MSEKKAKTIKEEKKERAQPKPRKPRASAAPAKSTKAKPVKKTVRAAKPRKPAKEPLKPEHERFAERVARGEKPAKVYAEIYPDTSPAAASSSASRLLNNANVLEEIEHRKRYYAKSANVTGEQVIGATAQIAFANIEDAYDRFGHFDFEKARETGATALIKSISRTPNKYGEAVRVEFYSRDSALDRLGDYLGLKQKDRENEITLEKVALAYGDWLEDNPEATEQEKVIFLHRFAYGGRVEAKQLALRVGIDLPEVQEIDSEQ